MSGSNLWKERRDARIALGQPIYKALTGDHTLLYDATGSPIIRGTQSWAPAQAEWRSRAHSIVDLLLDGVPPNLIPTSQEELENLLAVILHAGPEAQTAGEKPVKPPTIDIIDGKVSFNLGFLAIGKHRLEIKAGVPFAVLIGALIQYWLRPTGHSDNRLMTSSSSRIEPWEFPVWRTIEIGTHRSPAELIEALERTGVLITETAAAGLRKIEIAEQQELELIRVLQTDIGVHHYPPWDVALSDTTTDEGLYRDGTDVGTFVYRQARKYGLETVPAEVGPQLRLQYPAQPPHEALYVGMTPITVPVPKISDRHRPPTKTFVQRPCIFEVGHLQRYRSLWSLVDDDVGVDPKPRISLDAKPHDPFNEKEWIFGRRKRE